MAIVYLLTNKENGKQYVGKTVQPLDVRWGGHVGSARRSDNGMLVCRAIKKHGPDAFDRKILEECDESALGEREAHWIAELKTHVSQGGYNLTFGGDGGLPGYTFSEESKEKMRQKALGRKHTEETKAKMRAAKLGKHQSPEVIAKSVAKNTGKKRTEEQCARISASLTGRTFSDETRAKLSIANSMRVTSEETKRKLAKTSARAVDQLTEAGEVICTFSSGQEAAQQTGTSAWSISRAVNLGWTVDGFRWRRHVEQTQMEHS